MPNTTSQSLLRAAKSDPQSEAWFKLYRIYEPLISGWIVRAGIPPSDVADVTQEVLHTIAKELPKFEHNGRVGAFRNWVKLITIHRCRRYWNKEKRNVSLQNSIQSTQNEFLDQLEDPKSDLSELWKAEHDSFVYTKMLELIEKEFKPNDFEVFTRNALRGDSPKSLSEEFQISIGKVYKIKFNVLKRLREVALGIFECEHFAN